MRALIIGGAGAIGAAVARHAVDAGIETHVGIRPSSNPERLLPHPRVHRHALDAGDGESLARVLRAVRPDWVLMAAMTAGHPVDAAQRRTQLLASCTQALALMEAAHATAFAGTMTWLGSFMCYGQGDGGTVRRVDAALRPTTFRGAAKAAESIVVAQLAGQFGIPVTELRVSTAYGPWEQRERLVPSLMRAALQRQRVPVATTSAHRDWIHYEDIARACIASAARDPDGAMHRVVNGCRGRMHQARDVAMLASEITGVPLIDTAPFTGENHYGEATTGELPGDRFGWTPRIDLEAGLEDCWRWANTAAGRAYLLQPAGAA